MLGCAGQGIGLAILKQDINFSFQNMSQKYLKTIFWFLQLNQNDPENYCKKQISQIIWKKSLMFVLACFMS